MNVIDTIAKKTHINLINTKLIKENVEYIYNTLYIPIKNIYINNKNIPIALPISNDEFIKIFNYIKQSQLIESETFNNYVNNIRSLNKLTIDNLTLFYESNNKSDIIAIELFKISFSLLKFKKIQQQMTIIWISIPTKRNFNFNSINNETLKQSENKFEAFTASGITTHNDSNIITIITRFEEIYKLLIHELCHAFNFDGSNNYKYHKTIIQKYNNVKSKNNYNYDYCIYESYSELLSSYIFLLFKNIHHNEYEFKKNMYVNIIIEIIYSFNIIANLIILNGKTFNEFVKNPSFLGDLCFYEYYYLKSLMYNHLNIVLCNTNDDFINLYQTIINKIILNNDNKLLENAYNNVEKINNYRYMFYK